MRVVADRDVCIASENCVVRSPADFSIGRDGLVVVAEVIHDERGAELAIEFCPVGALSRAEP